MVTKLTKTFSLRMWPWRPCDQALAPDDPQPHPTFADHQKASALQQVPRQVPPDADSHGLEGGEQAQVSPRQEPSGGHAQSPGTLAVTDLQGHITHWLLQGGWQDAQAVVPAKTQPACPGSDAQGTLSPSACPVSPGCTDQFSQADPTPSQQALRGGTEQPRQQPPCGSTEAPAQGSPSQGLTSCRPAEGAGSMDRAPGCVRLGIWLSWHHQSGGLASLCDWSGPTGL